MCFGTPKLPTVNTPAPPPAPPGNAPSAPVLNVPTGSATDGMTNSPDTRRGAGSLKIDLNAPGSTGNGLSIPQ